MNDAFLLSRIEKAELTRRAVARRGGMDARRARAILLLSRGASWQQVMHKLRCSRAFVARWAARFGEMRIAGLRARHHGRQSTVRTPRLEARILEAGRTHGVGRGRLTTRGLAAKLRVSHMTVHRVWRDHGLAP